MKTLTVRLPEPLVAEIEDESRARRISKSEVVRERLRHAPRRTSPGRDDPFVLVADVVGAVDGLPPDLSSRAKRHLRAGGYGKERSR